MRVPLTRAFPCWSYGRCPLGRQDTAKSATSITVWEKFLWALSTFAHTLNGVAQALKATVSVCQTIQSFDTRANHLTLLDFIYHCFCWSCKVWTKSFLSRFSSLITLNGTNQVLAFSLPSDRSFHLLIDIFTTFITLNTDLLLPSCFVLIIFLDLKISPLLLTGLLPCLYTFLILLNCLLIRIFTIFIRPFFGGYYLTSLAYDLA